MLVRLGHLARHAAWAALALQLVLLVTGGPATGASGGGDFPR